MQNIQELQCPVDQDGMRYEISVHDLTCTCEEAFSDVRDPQEVGPVTCWDCGKVYSEDAYSDWRTEVEYAFCS